MGSDGFVEAEGQALLQFFPNNAVVSLSGSNPMHAAAMDHTRSLGTVVYLDVADEEILNRLAAMKVNRIVGQNEGRKVMYRVVCNLVLNSWCESYNGCVVDSVEN